MYITYNAHVYIMMLCPLVFNKGTAGIQFNLKSLLNCQLINQISGCLDQKFVNNPAYYNKTLKLCRNIWK